MKKILLAGLLSAFVAAPLIACDYGKDEAKDTKAQISAPRHSQKLHARTKKALKTVASAQSNKEKI